MKKLFFMLSFLFVFSFVYGQEEPVKKDEPAKDEPAKEEPAKTDEEIKEDAAKAQKELSKETGEPVKEEESAKAEETKQIFFDEKNDVPERNYVAGFKPEARELTKKWHFLPINISVGTSIQVGFTVAQLTHRNFEIRIGTLMLGPGFTFGADDKDIDDGFVPGLAFLGEVGIGKFFGNPLKDNCFGIILGVGSKVVFDIRKVEEGDMWNDGLSLDDTLYVDFLPIYLTYRWHKNDKFYDISLRIPLVWQNGVYILTDETRLYNGVPDMTLNFSFIF